MGACPFCKEAVEEDILEYGGRCPSCLIEIPGEDAPTDPGEATKAAQAAEEAAASSSSRAPLLAGALALVALIGGGAFLMSTPDTGAELAHVETGAAAYKRVSTSFLTIDLDDDDAAEAPSKAAPTAKKSSRKATRKAKPSKKSAQPTTIPELPDDDLDAVANVELQDAGSAVEEPGLQAPAGGVNDPAKAGIGVGAITRQAGGGSMDPSVGSSPRNRGAKAMEYCGDQIRDVAKAQMKQLDGQFSSCVDRVLKRDESFSSAVKVLIAVEKDGRIAAIDLRPSNTDDAEFLGCLEKTIKKTPFPRFCEGVDLAKTYYFGSQR